MSVLIPIRQLKPHPAQMRTVYDAEGMATLTLQLFQRGLDSWQPIVAAAAGKNGDYRIITGHRRRMAQLFAIALQDWVDEQSDREATIEVARTMIATLGEKLGSVEKAAEALLNKYGEREIPVVPFAGDQKAEVLALQAANFGREEADMLGIAHSFRQALESGASPEEIARNAGQSVHYVLNHLALTDIPAELAQRIAAGGLPMSVARTVADLPEPKRTGMAVFLLANEPAALTVKDIKGCAATLKKWNGIQVGLTFTQQTHRNIARALARLWSQVVEAYPEDAYAAATMLIYRQLHEEPWASAEKASLWFQALGGDVYYQENGIHWTAVVEHLLSEVSCDTCPLNQLPRQPLRSDLSGGQGGVLGMPCRVGEEASRCIHGLAPNDPFDVRVPWSWSEHEGVVHEGGHYRVKNHEQLEHAWQAQAALEKAEDEAAVVNEDESGASAATPPTPTVATPGGPTSPATQVQATAVPSGPSPVEKQRALIRDFMEQHSRLAVGHPFTTSCAGCRHFLEGSPTKDETVPHCAWADRPRRVHFNVLRPVQGEGSVVPVCRQYAPTDTWETLIPEHPEPAGLPREWVKEQVLKLAAAGRTYGEAYHPFEFLTGRPMSSSERYDDWFAKQLGEQIGNLSDGQLFTLLVWATAEWQRGLGKPFSLPLNDGLQFATYKSVDWREHCRQEKGGAAQP
jgi:hypothetical protein